MSAAYGIASFVDGMIKGQDIRNSREDRKLDRARQKRMDDLIFTQDARAAEEHDARMGVFNRQASDWQRARDQQNAWEEANAAAVAAANEAMAAGSAQSQSGADAPGLGLPVPPPPGNVASPMGLPLRAPATNNFAKTAERLGGIVPPQGLGVVAQPEQTPPVAPAKTPVQGQQDAGRARRLSIEGFGDVLIHPNGRLYDIASGKEILDPLAIGIVKEAMQPPAPTKPDPLGLMPNYQHSWGGSLGADAAEAGRRALAGIGAAEGAVADIARRGLQGAANAVNQVVNPVAGYVSGGAAPELGMFTGNGWESKSPADIRADKSKKNMEMGLAKLSGMWKARTGGNPAAATPSAPAANVAPAAAPETKALAETATQAMAATATPAMQAATVAAQADPKSPVAKGMGVKPGQKVTETQRKRAAGAFMDYYREYGAPIVMEEMLKRGDFAGAQAFQEFLDRGETKAAMENWAKAAFAANIGDMDTFASEIMTAYNRLDYFPDGTTIVEKESGFTRGRDGEITGARITFKDEKTGNTFEQVFSDPSDLVRMGITMLAPEEAFKHYAEQVAATEQAGAKAAEEALGVEKSLNTRIDAAAKVIMEASKGLDGVPTKSYAEARAEAEQAIKGLGALPMGAEGVPPPIMRRP